MSKRKPGRPKGSSSKNFDDEKFLSKVTDILIKGGAKSPTSAIKQVIGDDQASDLRRLQRKWTDEGDAYIRKAQEPFKKERWDKEARALKEAAPDLYERIRGFANSRGGKELLLNKGDGEKPIHFMSLGIVSLNEWLKKTTMHGAEKAEVEFPKTIQYWSKFGSQPDPEFLRTFGKLCIEKADQLNAEKAEDREGGKL